jgi:hypothetical protein
LAFDDFAIRNHYVQSMSLVGPSRHFVATQQLGCFWSEADIQVRAFTAAVYERPNGRPEF